MRSKRDGKFNEHYEESYRKDCKSIQEINEALW